MNNVVKNSKTSPKKSVTAKQQAKSNLTKRKNPDWDNLDRGYRYLTQDMKLPHDQAVAVMGNVVEESQGDYKAAQKNGGGRGLIQWDGKKVPSGRYSQWGSIWASVAKPANVYDSTTDTVKNYWAPWGGLKGDKVRQKFIKAPLKEKARIYAESYLRPGKPRIADRQLSTMQLDSIYNPRIKDVIVQKDGGMLEFLKNGSGIHIKEENKGKFTSYCGGKVTNECIQKGKNSSNPAIRKRATFAANARKWKHEGGGELIKKSQQGSQLPTAEDVIKRYKNGSYSRDIKSDYRNGYNTGYVDIQKITTDKPFHKQGTIQREIHYIMGSPIDTIFTETPPSVLPVKRVSRSAQRFGPWKNNEYVGNKNEYEKLKERWGKAKEEAEKTIIRKDGGTLKAQYGAPLNLSTEDIQGGLQYITQGLGKVWNIMNAPVVNVQPYTTASLPNGSQIEIPGTQTGIVDDSFGKGGGGKKVGKKLLQSVAKSKDKGLTVTKKVDSSVRHGLVNVDQDLRHFGGGNRRMDPEELIKEMDKHAEFRDIAKHLSKRFGNLKKDNPQSMKDFKALKNKYEDMFNDFLHNGIKKHQEGAKLTFGQKLGNFANSDLGKSVISNGLSLLSNKLFNKSASSNQEIAQAAQEKEQSTIDPIQVAQMIEIAKNQYADPDNPNANGGDIFNSYIKNQITAPILARQQEEHKKRLAAIEQQKNQAKSSAVGTFFNTLAQGGIEYLQNKYGTTEKADS